MYTRIRKFFFTQRPFECKFTLEGIIMNTRSGDIDPAVIEYICNKEGKTSYNKNKLNDFLFNFK